VKAKLIVLKRVLSLRSTLIAGFVFFKAVLDVSYVCFVAPLYGYAGYTFCPEVLKLLESYILLLVLALMMPWRVRRPSDVFIIVLFLAVGAPLLSLYSMRSDDRAYLYMVMSGFVVLRLAVFHPAVKLPALCSGRRLLSVLLLAGAALLFGLVIIRGGFRYFNLDWSRVYELRRTIAAQVFTGFAAYLRPWYANVIAPFLLVLALRKGRLWTALGVVGLQVLLFGLTAHKSVLLSPVLSVGAYFLARKRWCNQAIVLSVTSLVLLALVSYLLSGWVLPASTLVRRAFFVTAQNHYAYYYYFKDAGFVYLSNSLLAPFVRYPFALPPPLLISQYLKGNVETWANTGFLATSYMHFGFVGLLLFSLVVGLLWRVIDGFRSGKLPLNVVVATGVPAMWQLVGGDLPTVLLTHGLALYMVFLWLLSGRGSGDVRAPFPADGGGNS